MKKRSLVTFLLAFTLMLAMTLSVHASSMSNPDANGNFTFSITNGDPITAKSIRTPDVREAVSIIVDIRPANAAVPKYTITLYGPYLPATGQSRVCQGSTSCSFGGLKQNSSYYFVITPDSSTPNFSGNGTFIAYV